MPKRILVNLPIPISSNAWDLLAVILKNFFVGLRKRFICLCCCHSWWFLELLFLILMDDSSRLRWESLVDWGSIALHRVLFYLLPFLFITSLWLTMGQTVIFLVCTLSRSFPLVNWADSGCFNSRAKPCYFKASFTAPRRPSFLQSICWFRMGTQLSWLQHLTLWSAWWMATATTTLTFCVLWLRLT